MYPGNPGRPSVLESTAVYADGTLYLTSSQGRVVALDGETAKERWSYDPKITPNAG
jgi:quinoprotein glucose dehydrogenase